MTPSSLYASASLSSSVFILSSKSPSVITAAHKKQRKEKKNYLYNGRPLRASLPDDDKDIPIRFESIQDRIVVAVVERNKRRMPRSTVNAYSAASAASSGGYYVASSAAAMSSEDEKKLYTLTLAACLSMLAFGAACGCIAGALVYVEFGTPSATVFLSSEIKGAIVAALPLGAATACLAIGSKTVSERFGRKDIFRFANALYLASAALASLSNSYTDHYPN